VTTTPPFGAAKALRLTEGTIHVALVGAFPTEAEARDELSCGLGDLPTYRGIWRLPEPYGGIVHVFTDVEPRQLVTAGWAPPPNSADCLCPGEIPHPERGMQPGAAADHHARLAGETEG
jgi:hypothetical protein